MARKFKKNFVDIIHIFKMNVFQKKFKLYKIKRRIENFDLNDIKKLNFNIEERKKNNYILLFDKDLKEFHRILNQNLEKDELIFFEKNICSLKRIYINKKHAKDFTITASYTIPLNYITLYENYSLCDLYHELLHMASNPGKLEYEISGFLYTINGKEIFSSLNEGYTQALAERFNTYDRNSYELEKNIALALEKIVGKKKMQKSYFTCNLRILIDELLKYYSKNEIEKFIVEFDIAHELYWDKMNEFKLELLTSKVKYLIVFLFYGYCKKICNENLSLQQIQNLINEYFNLLNIYYRSNEGEKYICFDLYKINGILSYFFGNEIQIQEEAQKNILI